MPPSPTSTRRHWPPRRGRSSRRRRRSSRRCPARADPERLARGQEVAACEHGVVALPVLERGLGDRRARGEAGRRDEDVDAPVLEDSSIGHRLDGVFAGHVDLDRYRPPEALGVDDLVGDLLGPVDVQIGDDDMGAAGSEDACGRPADAARAARDQRDLPGELSTEAVPGPACTLEWPVLDREGLVSLSDLKPPIAPAASHGDRAVVERRV